MTVSALAAFAMVGLALEANAAGLAPFVSYVAASASCAALPVALRHPVIATALQCAATATLDLAAPQPPTEFPAATICVLTAHVAVVAPRHSWQIAVGVWWTLAGLAVLLDAVAIGHNREDEVLALVVFAATTLTALFGGIVYRYRLRIRGELAAARRDVEIEHERRTLAEERTRIARELHDVVAHSMSVIHMQATSASYRIKDIDPGSRAEFVRIADGARSTIREMRQLLAVLRDENADPSLAPVPGLDRLDELVTSTRQAGVPLRLTLSPVPALPDSVSMAGFRIVQEALSNVIRHAPGARTDVVVDCGPDAVEIEVVNEAPAAASTLTTPGGHGLPGMRERVRLVGGSLETGPTDDGGYRVYARLPRGVD